MTDTPNIDTRQVNRNRKPGRPWGSKDKFPRGRAPGQDYLKTVELNLRRALDRIDELESELGIGRPFDGDSLEMLRATQRGTYRPTLVQFHAAKVIYESELDQRRIELDGHRAELEEERIEYRRGSQTLDELIAKFEEITRDRSNELDTLVKCGDVTPSAATLIRSWFLTPETPELLALPPPESAAEPAPSAEEREDGEPPTPQPPEPRTAATNGFCRVVFAPRPFACFKTGSGRYFEGDSSGVVEIDGADDDDVKDLINSGCREHQ